MRMTPDMFDEVLERLTPRITKGTTNWRSPLDPGLKVAITLRHLASGSSYKDMQYGWRVPHNSISLLVREVCQAIVDEYQEELLSPPDTEEGEEYLMACTGGGTYQTPLVLLMVSTLLARHLPTQGQSTTITKDTSP